MSATPFSTKSRSGAVKEPASNSPEFEVLPPEQQGWSGGKDALPRLIAYLMDNLLQVPGTKARIGLNPLLDLVPIFGDGAAMVITALTLLEGARRRVPKIILARMGANVLLNGLMGTIPGVGEVFAFWFKPSQRNYHLLLKHTPAPGAAATRLTATWTDWAFVVGLITGVLVLIGVFVGLGFFFAYHLWRALLG